MSANPMLISGVNGIMRGLQGLDNVAQEIAELNIGGESVEGANRAPDLAIDEVATAIVDLKRYELQVQASTQVVKTADEMLGFLLDVRA